MALTAARLASRAIDFVLLLLLVRLLSPEEFGLAAVAALCVALAGVFRELGLTQAGVQRPQMEPSMYAALFWAANAIGLVVGALVFWFAPGIASILGANAADDLVRAIALIFPIQALGMAAQVSLQRDLNFKRLAVIQTASTVLSACVGAALALSGFGASSLVARSITEQALITAFMLATVAPNPFLRFRPSQAWELCRFGVPVASAQFLESLRSRSDDVLVSRSMGATSLGIYTVAFRVHRLVLDTLMSTVAQVALPAFSRLSDDRDRLLRAYYRAVRLSALVMFPVFCGLAVTADLVIDLMFGPEWIGAVPVMQVLALVGIASAIRYFDAPLIIAIGRVGINLGLRTVTAAVTVAGFVLVAPMEDLVLFAAVYAATAWCVGVPLWMTALRRYAGVSVMLVIGQSLRPLCASLLMMCSVAVARLLLADTSKILELTSAILVGGVAYCLVLVIIDRSGVRLLRETYRGMRSP